MCIRDSVNETLSKRVDDYEEEVRQQIAETKVGQEKMDETIIQLGVEVEARINQVENNNETRVKEVRLETQEKLSEVQIKIAGRIEWVNNEMKTMKMRQTHQRKLMNTREGLEVIKGGLVKMHSCLLYTSRCV